MLLQIRQLSKNRLILAASFLLVSCNAFAGQVTDSVVTIYCLTQTGSSQGTGFILGSQGLIVTAYHVVEDAKHIDIYRGQFKSLTNVTVEHIDPKHDVAILKSSESSGLSGLNPVQDSIVSQADVRVAGSPRGIVGEIFKGQITSPGLISSLVIKSSSHQALFADDIQVYVVDVTAYNGISGAPVIGAGDAVLGLYSGSYDQGRGIGWAIPLKYVTALIPQPALHASAENMPGWPPLTLMTPAWISLKRSYSKPFDAPHIEKLMLLEQSFKRLKGSWSAKNASMDPLGVPGHCEAKVVDSIKLSFDEVDDDSPSIKVSYREEFSKTAILTPNVSLYPTFDLAYQTADCNNFIFDDFSSDPSYRAASESKSQSVSATMTLSVDDVQDFASNNSMNTLLDVVDCQGGLCTPAIYGKNQAFPLEVISKEKLRWGNFIFVKEPKVSR